MPTLARKLRALDYFTLAFGTMVGVGWLSVNSSWSDMSRSWQEEWE